MKRKTLDTYTARRLAVLAECDPRTIEKVLNGEASLRIAANIRARKVLVEAGLLKEKNQ